jgi:hypothetical protein
MLARRVDLTFLGGLFSKEDTGSYAASVREEKGNPHHNFGNRRSHSSQTVTGVTFCPQNRKHFRNVASSSGRAKAGPGPR